MDLPNVIDLARLQFAFTVSLHIVFPTFSIGLTSYFAVLEGLWLATRRHVYLDSFRYWLKIFALTFLLDTSRRRIRIPLENHVEPMAPGNLVQPWFHRSGTYPGDHSGGFDPRHPFGRSCLCRRLVDLTEPIQHYHRGCTVADLILGYTAWSYWVFRGKVRAGEGYH